MPARPQLDTIQATICAAYEWMDHSMQLCHSEVKRTIERAVDWLDQQRAIESSQAGFGQCAPAVSVCDEPVSGGDCVAPTAGAYSISAEQQAALTEWAEESGHAATPIVIMPGPLAPPPPPPIPSTVITTEQISSDYACPGCGSQGDSCLNAGSDEAWWATPCGQKQLRDTLDAYGLPIPDTDRPRTLGFDFAVGAQPDLLGV